MRPHSHQAATRYYSSPPTYYTDTRRRRLHQRLHSRNRHGLHLVWHNGDLVGICRRCFAVNTSWPTPPDNSTVSTCSCSAGPTARPATTYSGPSCTPGSSCSRNTRRQQWTGRRMQKVPPLGRSGSLDSSGSRWGVDRDITTTIGTAAGCIRVAARGQLKRLCGHVAF